MITNGFDITQVLAALGSRIGWYPATQADSLVLTDANKASTSGRYFDQFHPMITLENIVANMEDENANAAQQNDFLARVKTGVITSVVNAVFNRPQLIETTLLFERQLRNDSPYTNAGKFCGYRFWVAPGQIACQISQVSLLFSGDATFKLYLFHDAIKAPLYEISVTVTAASEVIVELPDWIIKHIDKTKKIQGGVFYFGYFQNDLPVGVVALNQFVSVWNTSYAFGYTGFEILQTDPQPTPNFQRIAVPYTLTTYGMNVELQTYHDFTNLIIKNASLFDEVIGLSNAAVLLGYMSYSTRSNFISRMTKDMAEKIYAEINSSGSYVQTPYIAGLKKQIQREIERIQENIFYDASKCNEFTTTQPNVWPRLGSPLQRG